MIGVFSGVELAMILAAAIAVLVLPGLAFVYGLGGRGRSVPEWLALAFGTSAAAVVLLAETSRLLGLDVVVVSGALAGLAFLAIAAGLWRPPGIADDEGGYSRDWWGVPVLVLALAIGLLALWQGLALTPGSDNFYHLQGARSLLREGRTGVTDPFLPGPGMPPDLKSGSWPAVPAMISLFTGLDVLPVARVLNPFIAFFLLPGVYALARRLGAPGWAAFIATAGFAVGGTELELRNLFIPARIAPVVLVAGLVWLAEWAKERGARRLGAAALCLVAAAAIHPSALEAAIWLLTLAIAIAIIRRQRRIALPLSGLLAGIVAAYGLIASKALSATLSALGAGEGEGAATGGALVASVLWPGVGGLGVLAAGAGLLAAAAVLMRKGGSETGTDTTPFAAALGSTPALVAIRRAGLGLTIRPFGPALARMTFAAAFAPYVATAAVMRDLRTLGGLGRVRRVLVVASLVALLGLGPAQALTGRVARRFAGPDVPGSVAYGRAEDDSVGLVPVIEALYRAGARSGTVVAADADLSYDLAGLAGFKVIAVPSEHMSAGLKLADGPERLADLDAAFWSKERDPIPAIRALSKYAPELAVVSAEKASRFVVAGWRKIESVPTPRHGDYVVFVAGD